MQLDKTFGKSRILIDDYTYGQDHMTVLEWGEGANLRIGKFTSIAWGLEVQLGGNHRPDWISMYPFGHLYGEELGHTQHVGHPMSKGDVVIGNDVWIGRKCSILSGVTIGDGAVVGAYSVVTKDVLPYEVVGGAPAKHIKFRFSVEIIDLLKKLEYWNLPAHTVKEIAGILSSPPTKSILEELIIRYGRGKNV